MIVIAWFLQQSTWESATDNALYWLTFLPWLVVTCLLAKAIASMICCQQLRSRRLASSEAITVVVLIWLCLTCLISYTLSLTIPYAWATWPWCSAAVAIFTPLARVLVLPISLHFGRHL
jgi:hypothetical protein